MCPINEGFECDANYMNVSQNTLQVADMLDLPYADTTFDVVIEKGTLDVLFVDNDRPFDPKAEVKQRVFQMLNETHRYV